MNPAKEGLASKTGQWRRTTMKALEMLLEQLRQPQAAEAWARFVALYRPLMLLWAGRLGLRHEDAEDLVQEVLALLVVKLPEFRHEEGLSFRAWLRTVVVNKWRDHRRRAQLPMAVPQAMPLAFREGPDNVAQLWDEEERQHLVRHALEIMQTQFEPATWKACWGMVVEGQSAAALARELGISENAVYIAKSRILRRLRIEMKGMFD
jgi:RNA polymerase sigma-70 factor (ECF subfamily)